AFQSMKKIGHRAYMDSVNVILKTDHDKFVQMARDKAFGIDQFFRGYHGDVLGLRDYFGYIQSNLERFNLEAIKDLYPKHNKEDLPGYGYIHPEYGVYADFELRGKGCPWIPKRSVERLLKDDAFKSHIIENLYQVMFLNPVFFAVWEENKRTLDLIWIVLDSGVTNVYPPYNYKSIIKKDSSIVDLNENKEDYVRLLNPSHNPARNILWLEPYFDPIKRIWMTSCIAPIYQEDAFIGTLGMDILLMTIMDEILSIEFGKKGYAFLLAKTGKIIAMPKGGIEDFAWDKIHRKALHALLRSPEKQGWDEEMIKAIQEIRLDQSPDPAMRDLIAQLTSGETDISNVVLNHIGKQVAFAPVPSTGWIFAFVVPIEETLAGSNAVKSAIEEGTNIIMHDFTIFSVTVFCICFILGIMMYYRLVRPIAQFGKSLERIDWQNLEFNFKDKNRKDEIGQMYSRFSQMIKDLKMSKEALTQKSLELKQSNEDIIKIKDQLEKWNQNLENIVAERTHDLKDVQDQLVHSEQLAALGRLSGILSHELRNPLSIILNVIYLLSRHESKIDAGNWQEKLYIIKKQVGLANNIIENILDYSKKKEFIFKSENMNDLMDAVLDTVVIPKNVSITKEYHPHPLLNCDAFHLQRVLTNLILNAVQAIKGKGEIKIATFLDVNDVCMMIKDTGIGIVEDDLARVYDPLFSKKPRGIGLGLFIVKSIVEVHHGRINIKSEPGQGTVVNLRFPVC
ncbi:MAG: ATP-binding protein, partial [Chlamydiota bacterium]|nr:ATP-binding protein [Chlamydiota bacterium]